MREHILIAALGTSILCAQVSPPGDGRESPSRTGSVEGRILDADTGESVQEKVQVFAYGSTGRLGPIEAKGAYAFRHLEPGHYEIRILGSEYSYLLGRRPVTVTPGSETSALDIKVRLDGSVTGNVWDEDDEPVAAARILLVAIDYQYGQLIYSVETEQRTNERGEYRVAHVRAGRSYAVLVLPPRGQTEPGGSERFTLGTAWYPGPPSADGQSHFTLRSGEERRFATRLQQIRAHCVIGQVTAEGVPAALEFELAVRDLAGMNTLSGVSPAPGVVSTGRSSDDGSFRVCGIWPGDFRLSFHDGHMRYGYSEFSMQDKDINELHVNVHSPITLMADVRWNSTSSSNGNAVPAGGQTLRPDKVSFRLYPVDRAQLGRNEMQSSAVPVPGAFRLTAPAFTKYRLLTVNFRVGYIKDVQLEGNAPLSDRTVNCPEGTCSIKVRLSDEFGRIIATVQDEAGKPAGGVGVCAIPASVGSKAELADLKRCFATDLDTGIGSVQVPPGKYFMVVGDLADDTVGLIDMFWNKRTTATAVDVAVNAVVPCTVSISGSSR